MKSCLITGLIGSGKSEVCKILRQKGFPVYDSDSRTKALYACDPSLVARVEAATGLEKARWKELFSQPEKLEALEAIVHPVVLQDFRSFAGEQSRELPLEPFSEQWVFFESAIAGDKPLFRGAFDKVLLLRAPKEQREERNSAAAQRQTLQKEIGEWDYLILNDGSLEQLRSKTEDFLNLLCAEGRALTDKQL